MNENVSKKNPLKVDDQDKMVQNKKQFIEKLPAWKIPKENFP